MLLFFPISLKFQEEIKYFIIVPQKLYKKKVVTAVISIIEKEKELYSKIYYLNKNTIDTNHTLLQTLKQELAEIFKSKGNAFCMKATI